MRRPGAVLLFACFALLVPSSGRAVAACTESWHQIGANPFTATALPRSQGVTTDGTGWIFSWQGGLDRTNDSYVTTAAAPWPADIAVNNPSVNPDGTNHLINTHIGDIDTYGGKVYAPYEDGSEGPINNPEYQHPYIAVYDAKTLAYTGEHYALPLDLHAAGVPWVAINGAAGEAYTAEWDMPHDRINVFDLAFHIKRSIDLHYSPELGAGFHLSRIQGAKVYNGALYASRDDDGKSVFRIDIATGDVTKVFSINPTQQAELEGLVFRQSRGAQMHLLIVLDNDTSNVKTLRKIHVEFLHFAVTEVCA